MIEKSGENVAGSARLPAVDVPNGDGVDVYGEGVFSMVEDVGGRGGGIFEEGVGHEQFDVLFRVGEITRANGGCLLSFTF